MAYAPMYSSHGHDRKTHIAESGAGSLCGVERRYPDLLWTQGGDYYDVQTQFLIDNPGRERNGCLRCRKAYLTLQEQEAKQS